MIADPSNNSLVLEDHDYWTTFQTQLTDATGDLTTNINAETNSAANGSKLSTNFMEATNNGTTKYLQMIETITRAIG
jgi:hypothetical protein